MQQAERTVRPELKSIVQEASRALARLDAERLEELALSCRDLNGAGRDRRAGAVSAPEAVAAQRSLRILGRILETTRANLAVLNRLKTLESERLEYAAQAGAKWAGPETGYGDN